MARNGSKIGISVAASLVLYLTNASAQPIDDLIKNGDIDGVKAFVGTHDIDKLYFDYTPLCYAIKNNQVHIAQLLIDNGADVEKACHGKTPGLNKKKSMNRFSHSVDVKPENAEIPAKWKNGNTVRLGSRGELVCVSCHVTHNAPVNESLLSERNKKDSLCLQCHASQEKLIKASKHDLREMAPDSKNIRGETVSQSGPCSCWAYRI